MKKMLLSATALLMAASALAGYIPVQAEDTINLDVAVIETAYGVDLWQEVVEAYKEVNPNVEITLTQEKELEDALSPRFQSQDYPDVVMMAANRKLPTALIKDRALAELTDVLDLTVPGEEATVSEKIIPGFTDSTSTNPYNDGKTYLMPMFYSPTGLFYNAGLFKEKGWEVPKTWDEMWALAEVAKEEGIALFTYPTAGYLDTFFSSVILSGGGLDLFNKAMEYDPETWSGPQLTQIFEVLGKLAENTEATTVANANNEGFVRNQMNLLENKALFMPNGTWVVGEMADSPRADGFEWGMTAVPTIDADSDQYAYTFLEHIWVPEGAEEKDAAKEFIAFLYSDKAAEIFANHGAVQPVVGIEDTLPEDQQLFYKIYSDGVLPGMGGFVATESIEGVSLDDTLYQSFNSVVSGDLSVEDYQNQVVEVMKQFREKLATE